MLITVSIVTYHTWRPQGRAFLRSSAPNRRELPRPLRMWRIQQHPISPPHRRIHGPGRRHLPRPRRASNKYETNARFRDPERWHIDLSPGSNEPRNPSPIPATQRTGHSLNGISSGEGQDGAWLSGCNGRNDQREPILYYVRAGTTS